MKTLKDEVAKLAGVDLFKKADDGSFDTGVFVGRPFQLDYQHARLLVSDAWKIEAKGLPQGAFLLAYYENEPNVAEALLLRIVRPATLPTDSDVVLAMVESYKDNITSPGQAPKVDSFTRYEFGFSGLECRILGTFYRDADGRTRFGADVENFYAANNYGVVKPRPDVLELITNFREEGVTGKPTDIRIGRVRYSSSRRFQESEPDVPVFITPADFLGKRTALFGMTRTGKSNSVKKIIEATVEMTEKAQGKLATAGENVPSLAPDGVPSFSVGQIIFDINGEYANKNMQDEGTAIFERFEKQTDRYSTIKKDGFKVMKVNFYTELAAGMDLINSYLGEESGDYVKNFLSVDVGKEVDPSDRSEATRFGRRLAAYQAVLCAAGFEPPKGHTIKFKNLNKKLLEKIDVAFLSGAKPDQGLTPQEAVNYFNTLWDNYEHDAFKEYKQSKGHEWADEELKALLVFLSRKKSPGGNAGVSGYLKLAGMREQHTNEIQKAFEDAILEALRSGRIVIVDLSQGNPAVQAMYSERLCRKIFSDSMGRFIAAQPNNFIQFYFEEAHNLFPKRDDKDLSQIYNRIAKEGAKLNLGLLYATQEVSSISSNILKNTQNWFIAHLNNEDETRELRKYYDFSDFTDSLIRFSADTDRGFVRMKTYSNPYIVPVQVNRFPE